MNHFMHITLHKNVVFCNTWYSRLKKCQCFYIFLHTWISPGHFDSCTSLSTYFHILSLSIHHINFSKPFSSGTIEQYSSLIALIKSPPIKKLLVWHMIMDFSTGWITTSTRLFIANLNLIWELWLPVLRLEYQDVHVQSHLR